MDRQIDFTKCTFFIDQPFGFTLVKSANKAGGLQPGFRHIVMYRLDSDEAKRHMTLFPDVPKDRPTPEMFLAFSVDIIDGPNAPADKVSADMPIQLQIKSAPQNKVVNYDGDIRPFVRDAAWQIRHEKEVEKITKEILEGRSDGRE